MCLRFLTIFHNQHILSIFLFLISFVKKRQFGKGGYHTLRPWNQTFFILYFSFSDDLVILFSLSEMGYPRKVGTTLTTLPWQVLEDLLTDILYFLSAMFRVVMQSPKPEFSLIFIGLPYHTSNRASLECVSLGASSLQVNRMACLGL